MMKSPLFALLLLCIAKFGVAEAFATQKSHLQHHNSKTAGRISSLSATEEKNTDKEDKFSFQQRIESVKTAAVGAISGGIAATPFIGFHDIPLYGIATWEFDTDMGSLQSALFAIVYRYCVREEDDNEMLNMGVVGAFVVVRTLSRVRVPEYCTAVPLTCGSPLSYFDWNMIQQLALNGLESAALFGAAAVAMEFAYKKEFISKFPN
mmetsp:Transcript_25518/g.43259  ORF Transcript_25518/g.43259 Transcript_25518/m.43259 type:complete len:207 (+) Transcript_25518:76-696(+)